MVQADMPSSRREAWSVARARIVEAALGVASQHGLLGMTRDEVARRAGVAAGKVNYAVGSMEDLRNLVVERAVETAQWEIVGQALALRIPSAMVLDETVKSKVRDALL